MKKTLFSILLILCLVVGLLPVTALADSTANILLMGSVELSVTEGGAPVYTRNKAFDAANTPDGTSTFQAWTQEICDGTGSWNVKFEWPASGIPTITLKDAKFDYYDNDAQAYAYLDKGGDLVSTANRVTSDLESDGSSAFNLLVSAIMPAPGYCFDLDIVLKGNNLVETGSGFVLGDPGLKANGDEQAAELYAGTHFENLTFTGEGENNTTVNCDGIGIFTYPGYDVVFNSANLAISTTATGTNAIPIHVTSGNLTIDGGKIQVTKSDRAGIWTQGSGDIIINDGTVSVTGSVGKAPTNGVLQSAGMLIINGGTVNANPKNAVGIYAAAGIEVNGGNVNVVSPYYGINAGGDIIFNGGTTTVLAQNAFYSGNSIAFGPDVDAYAGVSKKSCQAFDGSNTNLAKKPWMLITDDENQKIEFDDEDDLPTVPTSPTMETRPSSSKVTRPPISPTYATGDDAIATSPSVPVEPDETIASEETAATEATIATAATTAPTETKAPTQTRAPATTKATQAPSATQSADKSKATKMTIAEKDKGQANGEKLEGPNAILIIVLVVVVLAAAGGAAWFALRPKPTATDGTPATEEKAEETTEEKTEE